MSISVGVLVSIDSGCDLRWVSGVRDRAIELYTESHRDERVCQREHEISRYGGAPSPKHKLVELEGRVAFVRLEVFEVDWQVEREREERYDDEIYQSNRLGRDGDIRVEWPQVVHAEANSWAQGLRRLHHVLLECLV